MTNLNVWKALLATVIYLVVLELLGFTVLLSIYVPISGGLDMVFLTIHSLTFLYKFIFLLLVFFLLRKYIFSEVQLKDEFKNILIPGVAFALLLGVCIVFSQPLIKEAFSLIPGYPAYDGPSYGTEIFHFWRIPSLLAAILIGPITEELFFRGFLLRGLLHKYRPVWAILISSLLFAALHFNWYNPNVINLSVLVITFLGGLMAGWLYIKYSRVIYPILFHICWNFMANFAEFVEVPYFTHIF
ncbi:MAG: CPBP family intramembrane metalloprotease [Crocinitomicaceae bacterium]|nr:CPBP family intramembrane metalloprotease [Crocinitomicaceae bacterium]